jgi:hypothetical protein
MIFFHCQIGHGRFLQRSRLDNALIKNIKINIIDISQIDGSIMYSFFNLKFPRSLKQACYNFSTNTSSQLGFLLGLFLNSGVDAQCTAQMSNNACTCRSQCAQCQVCHDEALCSDLTTMGNKLNSAAISAFNMTLGKNVTDEERFVTFFNSWTQQNKAIVKENTPSLCDQYISSGISLKPDSIMLMVSLSALYLLWFSMRYTSVSLAPKSEDKPCLMGNN